jgi:hypothetical protein
MLLRAFSIIIGRAAALRKELSIQRLTDAASLHLPDRAGWHATRR